jgi:hypothetical protein
VTLAFHNYQEVHGTFPPAAVRGKDGKELLSWRVLLLPYLEEQSLYAEFRLDEPWDSPYNLCLLKRRPSVYAPPGSKARGIPAKHTYYKVFVGPGAAFEDPAGQSLASFTDNTSSTVLVVEAGEPVPWTKPEDLEYAPGQPLPPLSGPFQDIIRVSVVSGSTHYLPRDTDEATWRALITRNGGEKVDGELRLCRSRR